MKEATALHTSPLPPGVGVGLAVCDVVEVVDVVVTDVVVDGEPDADDVDVWAGGARHGVEKL